MMYVIHSVHKEITLQTLFLNQARAWFLKLFLRGRLYVCVCPRPQGYWQLAAWCGVIWTPIWLVKQVLQLLYGNCVVSLMGVALALICVMESNPIRVS